MSTTFFSNILRLLILAAIVCAVAAFSETAMAQTTDGQTDEASASKTNPNSITGRVISETGQPINNATVSIRKLNSPAPARPVPATGEGNFVFAGLESGVYSVTATAPSYVPQGLDFTAALPEYHHIGDSVTITMVKGGVINGTVTDASGEPVVAVRVRAQMVADANTHKGWLAPTPIDRLTDDRGVFRLYGLAPGTYVVSAGGRDNGGPGVAVGRGGGRGGGGGFGFGGGGGGGPATALYDRDAPTFAPSSTRDTAAEFLVTAGSEINDINIRYRGERGHAISGIVKAIGTSKGGYAISSVTLSRAKHADEVISTTATRGAAFVFYGVPDGEYELLAQTTLGTSDAAISRPLHVVVNGNNLTGLVINTNSLASVAGRFALEPSAAPECKDKPQPRFEELLISAQRDTKRDTEDATPRFNFAASAAGRDGSFLLDRLAPGQYRFGTNFPAKYWYVRSITLSPTPAAAKTPGKLQTAGAQASAKVDAARDGVSLKFGSRVANLLVTLSEGAASIRGRVAANAGGKTPTGQFAYLIPAEKDQGDNVLRFYAAPIAGDGSFAFDNLAPGLYWMLARLPIEAQAETWLRSIEGKEERARLRREGAEAKTTVELKPCQGIVDYPLTSAPTMGQSGSPAKP